MNISEIKANPGKKLSVEIEGELFYRYPIKTHLISKDDDIITVVRKYLKDIVQDSDLVAISEKAVAITQGRAFTKQSIKPSWFAKLLSHFVYKTPFGIGLGIPETMQLAIEEVGWFRIFIAAALSAITKPFRIRGVFYRVAGRKAASIDGPVDYAIPPYNQYCSKGPENPSKVAREIATMLRCQVAIIDACDLGVEVLGASEGVDTKIVQKIFKDNPLGQSSEQTPIALVRRERPGEEL